MADIPAAIRDAKALLGDRLSTAKAVLEHHGQNESYYALMPPDAVAFVRTTEEVSALVKICAKHKCPIIPWGVGTSLEGHAIAPRGGLTIDFSQMNKLLEVYEQDLQVRIQPGVTREQLNTELRATGLFFPIDPGANATLGGMTATRASGTTAVRYGTMRDNVLALEVVLSDGRIITTGSRAKKSSAGYDLTHLMVGSEGTLGIITEITLKLQGQPEATSAAICDFPTIDDAVNAVITAVQTGIPIARIELVDPMMIKAINSYSNMTMPETPHLFMEFHGSEMGVKEQAQSMKAIADDFSGGEFSWATKAEERNRLWAARHNAYPAAKALRPGFMGLSTDICVPISRLADAIRDTENDIASSGMLGPIIGHVGDGNYHSLLLIDPDDPKAMDRAMGLSARMAERALSMGGTVTGEHGVGIGKMKYMAAEHGEGWSVMADIKRTLDPDNILNPGKIVQIN